MDFYSLLGKNAFQFLGDFFVFERNDAWQHFDQSDFRSETAVDRCKLHADGAAANDEHRFRNVFEIEHTDVAEYILLVEVVSRQGFRFRSGCDDDVLRVYFRRPTIALYRNLRWAYDRTETLDDSNLVFSKEELDALRHLVDNIAFPFLDLREIDADVTCFEQTLLGCPFHFLKQVGVS